MKAAGADSAIGVFGQRRSRKKENGSFLIQMLPSALRVERRDAVVLKSKRNPCQSNYRILSERSASALTCVGASVAKRGRTQKILAY